MWRYDGWNYNWSYIEFYLTVQECSMMHYSYIVLVEQANDVESLEELHEDLELIFS